MTLSTIIHARHDAYDRSKRKTAGQRALENRPKLEAERAAGATRRFREVGK